MKIKQAHKTKGFLNNTFGDPFVEQFAPITEEQMFERLMMLPEEYDSANYILHLRCLGLFYNLCSKAAKLANNNYTAGKVKTCEAKFNKCQAAAKLLYDSGTFVDCLLTEQQQKAFIWHHDEILFAGYRLFEETKSLKPKSRMEIQVELMTKPAKDGLPTWEEIATQQSWAVVLEQEQRNEALRKAKQRETFKKLGL